MPNLKLKKPSKLQAAIPIKSIYITTDNDNFACRCPSCGTERKHIQHWFIDSPTMCGANIDSLNNTCACRFVITNDTPIED